MADASSQYAIWARQHKSIKVIGYCTANPEKWGLAVFERPGVDRVWVLDQQNDNRTVWSKVPP